MLGAKYVVYKEAGKATYGFGIFQRDWRKWWLFPFNRTWKKIKGDFRSEREAQVALIEYATQQRTRDLIVSFHDEDGMKIVPDAGVD